MLKRKNEQEYELFSQAGGGHVPPPLSREWHTGIVADVEEQIMHKYLVKARKIPEKARKIP